MRTTDKDSVLDSFKLYFEELIEDPTKRFKGPGRGSIMFEDALFGLGNELKFLAIWLAYFSRFELKKALFSTSIMLWVLYNRL